MSLEQLSAIFFPLVGVVTKDLVFFVKQFYEVNQRWPADAAELQSFVGTKFRVPYEDLQIVQNADGHCLLSYTGNQGYEAKITVFRADK